MKSIFPYILFVLIFSFACNNVSVSKIAYTIDEKDLIPEGITYSSTTHSFYLSSLNKTKIIKIDERTGEYKDFISSNVLNMMVLGLNVDEERGFLWTCAEDAKQKGRSTVAKFDLQTGELLKSFDRQDTSHFTVNDLTIDSNGNVYYTNRAYHSVYKIDIETDSVQLIIQSTDVEYPNGIAISPNDKYLYVASASQGIRIIDLTNNKLLTNKFPFDSKRIDGLKLYNNSLYAVKNTDNDGPKIVQYLLDQDLTTIVDQNIIDGNSELLERPTTLVIANGELFVIGNSQIDNFSLDGAKDTSLLKDIRILKYQLK